ncbi:MAG: alpha/beta fold hydrolase [Parvularculaceae bacterium]
MRKIFLTLMVITAALVIVPYVWIGMGDKPFDDQARALAPGEFAALSSGQVHYVWVEPAPENANGETVVLFHGLYVPNFMFVANAEALAASGYRVLLPDHYGHGFSDRPTEDYDQAFFARQVGDLLTATGIKTPVILGGQSTGAMVATLYASQYPEHVKALLLIVPAGIRMQGSDQTPMSKILRAPVVGEWVWRVLARRKLRAPYVPACTTCGDGKLLGDAYVQAEYRGYFPAMLNILRHFPLRRQEAIFKTTAEAGVPILAIFGAKDETVHIESAKILAEVAPDAKIVIIEEGDHSVNFRNVEAVNPVLLEYLKAAL